MSFLNSLNNVNNNSCYNKSTIVIWCKFDDDAGYMNEEWRMKNEEHRTKLNWEIRCTAVNT